MQNMPDISAITARVLKRITPSPSERKLEEQFVSKILDKIESIKGPHLGAMVAGSVVRDTHLKNDRDVDFFVFYSSKLKRKTFEKEGLKLANNVFGKHFHEEAYSEHPYVRGNIDGFNIEVVPVYEIRDPAQKISAVDRTPFHAQYMMETLSSKKAAQVRLLKQFLKGIQAYGADIKMQGVPGYLVELLIIEYGSFTNAVKNISKWKDGAVIDVENHFSDLELPSQFFQKSFLIVVDPVDPARNVASALSYNQFARMILAARTFLKKPSENFFFPKTTGMLSIAQINSLLKTEELMGIHFPYPKKIVEDVVWGQIQRISKKMANGLENHDFMVRRKFFWTDGNQNVVLLFDVANPVLQKSKTRIGPKVVDEKHVEDFLKSHKKPLSGPRIENGRIVLEVSRKIVSLKQGLEKELKNTIRTENGPVRPGLKKARIISESRLVKMAGEDKELHRVLSVFLKGKEFFL
jgi:tRNA nucleotidyltransferase (CCA-adding enzyme)